MADEPTKRGRPRKFPKETISAFKLLYPEVRTERSIENKIHLGCAFGVIQGTELEPFFNDPHTGKWREGIMVELGKLEAPELIYEIARQVVELASTPGHEKTTVREWQELIRVLRMDIFRNGFVNSEDETEE